MNLRHYKIILIITSFIFLNGFLTFIPLLGPGLTIATSGNVYKASAQFIIDTHIKKKTGKNSLAHVKDEIEKQNIKQDFNADFKKLVETRVKIAHKKIIKQNKENYLNKDLRNLVKKRIKIARKLLNREKINQ